MDEFSARCVGELQSADSTTMDSDILRDSIVLLVKLPRRPSETRQCAPDDDAMRFIRAI